MADLDHPIRRYARVFLRSARGRPLLVLATYVTAVGFAAVGAVFLARAATDGRGTLWAVAVPALTGAAVTIGAGWFGPVWWDASPLRRDCDARPDRRESAARDDAPRERRASESAPPVTPRSA